MPLELEPENANEVLEVGDTAYWSPGTSMCIFFGPTPSSKGNEVRAYSPVTVFGRMTGDAKSSRNVKDRERIRVELRISLRVSYL